MNAKRYQEFEQAILNQIAKNLYALTTRFLGKFHVSQLPGSLGAQLGGAPWTFYTVGGALNTATAGEGIVIVRPPSYPFARTPADESNPSEQHVAVAWPLGVRIDEAVLLRERILTLFEGTLRTTDRKTLQKQKRGSLKLTNHQGVLNGKHGKQAEAEDSVAWADFPPAAEIGVVCALPEETDAVRKSLKGGTLRQIGNRTYDVGYYKAKGTHRTYTIALRTCEGMGNVYSALASLQLIQDWEPSWLFLVGICAGDKKEPKEGERPLRLGDVIVPRSIIGYEYQKLQQQMKNPYDLKVLPCSSFLHGTASRPLTVVWEEKSSASGAASGGSDEPFVWAGEVDVLCGSKVMDDADLLKKLMTDVGQAHRKVIGIEMEGEGAAAAARASGRAVEFLFIKGVSDYAQEKGEEADRVAAMNNAARVLFALLDELARGETRVR